MGHLWVNVGPAQLFVYCVVLKIRRHIVLKIRRHMKHERSGPQPQASFWLDQREVKR